MRYLITYFFVKGQVKVVSKDSDLLPQHFVTQIRGLRDAGGQGALPGLENGYPYSGPILITRMSEMPDKSHGPADYAYIILPMSEEETELEKIRERLIAAGVTNFSSPLQGVNFVCRLLEESQRECLSLRRRINVLIEQYPLAQQPTEHSKGSTDSPEVHSSTDGESAEGSTSKPEGEGSGAGVEC